MGKPEWPAPPVNRSTAGHWGVVAIRSRLTVFRPGVFPWPAHTVHRHPMSSISVPIISHLTRTRALTQPIPTRYHGCCFHSLGGEEEVARGPRRPGSGPAMGSRSPKEEGADPGAIPVAGQVLSRSRRAVRGGAAGPAAHRVVPGSQPTQCNTLGLARGSGPFEPPTGESSPLAPPSPPPLPSPSPLREASMAPEATGKLSTTTARTPPSERKTLGWLKSRATPVRHQGFLGDALVRLHRLDPRRRKSSIISRPLEAGFSCSHWSIFSMTTSKPPWCSTVSQSASAIACRRPATPVATAPLSRDAQAWRTRWVRSRWCWSQATTNTSMVRLALQPAGCVWWVLSVQEIGAVHSPRPWWDTDRVIRRQTCGMIRSLSRSISDG